MDFLGLVAPKKCAAANLKNCPQAKKPAPPDKRQWHRLTNLLYFSPYRKVFSGEGSARGEGAANFAKQIRGRLRPVSLKKSPLSPRIIPLSPIPLIEQNEEIKDEHIGDPDGMEEEEHTCEF